MTLDYRHYSESQNIKIVGSMSSFNEPYIIKGTLFEDYGDGYVCMRSETKMIRTEVICSNQINQFIYVTKN